MVDPVTMIILGTIGAISSITAVAYRCSVGHGCWKKRDESQNNEHTTITIQNADGSKLEFSSSSHGFQSSMGEASRAETEAEAMAAVEFNGDGSTSKLTLPSALKPHTPVPAGGRKVGTEAHEDECRVDMEAGERELNEIRSPVSPSRSYAPTPADNLLQISYSSPLNAAAGLIAAFRGTPIGTNAGQFTRGTNPIDFSHKEGSNMRSKVLFPLRTHDDKAHNGRGEDLEGTTSPSPVSLAGADCESGGVTATACFESLGSE
ncbi:MAG: hypothetical protein V4485_02655 [Pseudomonadota bacterium]